MLSIIKETLNKEGIERIGIIDISECDVINQRLLPADAKSAIIFCIPYRTSKEYANDGISEYARVYDYHKFSSALYSRIIDSLSQKTNMHFYGFCDHSPINEKLAAAKSGLGVIGKNSLFIDDIYGSFVFIGSIISDLICEDKAQDIRTCIGCNICITACPSKAIVEFGGIDRELCLSGISQKKKKSAQEIDLLKQHNIVWGCDICQIACPYNENAKISPISYFKNTRASHIDKEFILSLSDDEFNNYAFSYRGRQTILDNMD